MSEQPALQKTVSLKGHRTITLASSAGFCYGVKRAVDRAFEIAAQTSDAVTLGPIIHNPQIVQRLQDLGVPSVSSPQETHPGQTVIIRSHGVAQSVYDQLDLSPCRPYSSDCAGDDRTGEGAADRRQP